MWKGGENERLLVTVILREGCMAIVSKLRMKAKVGKAESSRGRSATSNGAWGLDKLPKTPCSSFP